MTTHLTEIIVGDVVIAVEVFPTCVRIMSQRESGGRDYAYLPFEAIGDVCAALARIYDAQMNGDVPRRSP